MPSLSVKEECENALLYTWHDDVVKRPGYDMIVGMGLKDLEPQGFSPFLFDLGFDDDLKVLYYLNLCDMQYFPKFSF